MKKQSPDDFYLRTPGLGFLSFAIGKASEGFNMRSFRKAAFTEVADSASYAYPKDLS